MLALLIWAAVLSPTSTEESRTLLRQRGLRATAPRLAVLRILMDAENPLSHTEVLGRLGETDWDQATIYRNLVKLRDARIATVVSRAEGIDRYALSGKHGGDHHHAHFYCEDCGRVVCLPAELTATMSLDGLWADSIHSAMVQLRGSCPDCLRRPASP
ncbi:MAG: Fur family transcriptional regulator [Myxococcota bacterium]